MQTFWYADLLDVTASNKTPLDFVANFMFEAAFYHTRRDRNLWQVPQFNKFLSVFIYVIQFDQFVQIFQLNRFKDLKFK